MRNIGICNLKSSNNRFICRSSLLNLTAQSILLHKIRLNCQCRLYIKFPCIKITFIFTFSANVCALGVLTKLFLPFPDPLSYFASKFYTRKINNPHGPPPPPWYDCDAEVIRTWSHWGLITVSLSVRHW